MLLSAETGTCYACLLAAILCAYHGHYGWATIMAVVGAVSGFIGMAR